MKTFDEIWLKSGYSEYSEEDIKNVKLGWELATEMLAEELSLIGIDLREKNSESNRIQHNKDILASIKKMEEDGRDIPSWYYPCCDNEKRGMSGGCMSCGDPCF
jgi:hypothetical protein